MIKVVLAALLSFWAVGAGAQDRDFSGLARLDADTSSIEDGWRKVDIGLSLSQGVPYRVFTLDNPRRLVLDFREVDWRGIDAAALNLSEKVLDVRVGGFRPGWSRMVLDLAAPLAPTQVSLRIDEVTGRARLELELQTISAEAFSDTAGAPDLPGWAATGRALKAEKRPRQRGEAPLVVVLDPGHGGIDPGAEVGAVAEKDLMLTFARELQEVLRRAGGFDVVLTRDGDYFVSLEARVALARDAGADVFVSIHADALAEGVASGAAVYTLSDAASDAASAALAERHNRDDLLAGLDLGQSDDRVANVLMSLARLDNAPRSAALAEHMLAGIRNAVGRVHKRPMRSAGFSVLKAADIPSVLLEVGFLSTAEDLKNLNDPIWRQGMAAGIRDGLMEWRSEDTALAPLRRN